MLKNIQLFTDLHNAFFENDDNNMKALGAGFVASALSIALIFVLYPF